MNNSTSKKKINFKIIGVICICLLILLIVLYRYRESQYKLGSNVDTTIKIDTNIQQYTLESIEKVIFEASLQAQEKCKVIYDEICKLEQKAYKDTFLAPENRIEDLRMEYVGYAEEIRKSYINELNRVINVENSTSFTEEEKNLIQSEINNGCEFVWYIRNGQTDNFLQGWALAKEGKYEESLERINKYITQPQEYKFWLRCYIYNRSEYEKILIRDDSNIQWRPEFVEILFEEYEKLNITMSDEFRKALETLKTVQ
ncbi:hypothetical protein SAMN02745248_01999 [Hathewaya proteolytica DSM 3090]|uniref:Uncharacterized protein n=1 Tax=Hathewaya proteolytica DSM 3090 TaxID=1121331 RepID=A0A1M6QF89_9CLOT|nr:hypothetical protein [Hathewaya proteolytica]SHK18770.1 hypothetical protein SAMN02745248_01999 [Hathewaya proteolytica DSM 3090]